MDKLVYIAIGLDLGWDCLKGIFTSIKDLSEHTGISPDEIEEGFEGNTNVFVDQESLTTVYKKTICI